jgi:hypothetical protein
MHILNLKIINIIIKMNKLDYLAQKEEELRKLNEQLDQRKVNILSKQPAEETLSDPLADSLDARRTHKNPFEENAAAVNVPSSRASQRAKP